MPLIESHQILLKDPLSKETRTERRILLGASAVGIVIVKTGLVPSKISALGIEFNQTDQHSLLRAVAAVIVYFLFAFLIYAGSDYIAWQLGFRRAVGLDVRAKRRREKSMDEDERIQENVVAGYYGSPLLKLTKPMSLLRAVFEFVLPIVISIYAVVALLRAHL